MRNYWMISGIAIGLLGCSVCFAQEGYSLKQEISLSGSERATCLAMDENMRRLYVGRETAVDMVDVYANRVSPAITNMPNLSGFTLAPRFSLGFCFNSSAGKMSGVDLQRFRTRFTPKTGKTPRAALYHPGTSELYVCNVDDPSIMAYEADDGDLMHTLPLPGKPVAVACDSKPDRVYCNLEGKDEITVIDARSHKVTATWPTGPGEKPSALAVDSKNHRLFVNCANKQLLMLDSLSGKVITRVAVGEPAGACLFHPDSMSVFSISEDGTLTIAREEAPDKLKVIQILKTEGDARGLAVEPVNRHLYLIKAGAVPAVLVFSPHAAAAKK